MSVFDNPKNLQRWCAALTSDFELVISQFMTAEDWKFTTFKEKANKCGTILLHHCAVGKGKKMAEQHEFITRILLQTAKDLWLVAPMGPLLRAITTGDPPVHEPLSRVKQMVAGFYLTYVMYKTRIVCGADQKLKIGLDCQDLVCLHYFRKCVLESDGISTFVKRHIQFLMADLYLDSAYDLVTESTMCGIHPVTRLYNNIMRSATSEINRDLKDRQCNNILPMQLNEMAKNITTFEIKKSIALKDSLSSSAGLAVVRHCNFPPLEVSPSPLMNVIQASTICHLLNDTPVQTVPNMLANNIADRAMMFESRKRIERNAHKRSGNRSNCLAIEAASSSTTKKSGPYIQEGGIFGRKKTARGQDDQGVRRPRTERQPAESSSNLWSYILYGKFNDGSVPDQADGTENGAPSIESS